MTLYNNEHIRCPNFEGIAEELKKVSRWILWKSKKGTDGKIAKVPVLKNGESAGWNLEENWHSFEEVRHAFETRKFDGIGFVLGGGFVGIDIDDCLIEGSQSETAVAILNTIHSYYERSVSGRGYHVILRGEKPAGVGSKNSRSQVELYDNGRFFTITGDNENVLAVIHQQEGLESVVEKYLPSNESSMRNYKNNHHKGGGSVEKSKALQKLKTNNQAKKLYEGNIKDYGSQSEADMALCGHLARCTNQNITLMDTLFRESELMRDKWEEKRGKSTYGEITMRKVLDSYDDKELGGGTTDREEPKERQAKAEQLLDLIQDSEASVFESNDRNTYITFPVENHLETWPVDSSQFNMRMVHMYYEHYNKTISKVAIEEAISILKSQAMYGVSRKKEEVFLRVGSTGENLYVDMCNDTWEVIEITSSGWRILPSDKSPIKFQRNIHMKPLPRPVAKGNVEQLKRFVNVGDNEWLLFVSWIVNTFNNQGAYPLLVMQGSQGSGKSTHCRIVRSLIDPHETPIKAMFQKNDDVSAAASANWILAYDNLSGLSGQKSDILAQLSTGMGFSKRQLYSNNEEFTVHFKRPIMLNGIDDITTRGDLASRSLVINLPSIEKGERQAEGKIWKDFIQAQPAILGGIFNLTCEALKKRDHIVLPDLPRMADFAAFGSSIEEAMGYQQGDFLKYFEANQMEMENRNMELNPFLQAIIDMMKTQAEVEGTATEVLKYINCYEPWDQAMSSSLWPNSPIALGRRLQEYKEVLKNQGISFEQSRKSSKRKIVLKYLEKDNLFS